MMEDGYKIRFDSITMEFPGVKALDDVSFGIKKGCVHVLMGENGAGKSTLMKILNGSYSATSGTVFINEQPKKFRTTSEATHEGIAMIYQELSYMPDMTVEDYLMLCREPKKGCFIDWKKSRQEAKEILKRGFEL
nr:ATP-binding cassette domain-containing protein [uncultured Blautia sp.]